MKIKGVIFDMDGVLIDSERVSNLAWIEVGKKYGIIMNEERLKKIKGGTYQRTKTILEEEFKILDSERFLKEKKDVQERIYIEEKGVKLKTGVIEFLEYLEKNNIKKAVATSSHKEIATRHLKNLNIYDRFDTFTYGDEVVEGKPAPDIFLKATEKLGLSTDEVIVVEDSVLGATASNNAQIRCIVVEDTIKFDEKESKLAFLKLKSLLELEEYCKKTDNFSN